MLANDSFDEQEIRITAGGLGIRRAKWIAINAKEATEERALEIMRGNHFDVLPIETGNESAIQEYYCTSEWKKWSRETIVRARITFADLLPVDTTAIALIERFATTGRLFFFLTSRNRVSGLVSIVNLNSKLLQVALFDLLCHLEIQLGCLLSLHYCEAEIIAHMQPKESKRYSKDKAQGLDERPTEYLYLLDLLKMMKAKRLHELLGYRNPDEVERLTALNQLRVPVMHPLKSLVGKRQNVAELWERLQILQDVLFRLTQLTGQLTDSLSPPPTI